MLSLARRRRIMLQRTLWGHCVLLRLTEVVKPIVTMLNFALV